MIRRLSPAVVILVARGLSASAQDLPCPEFRANVFTTGDQRAPAVASAPDGRFLLVWTSNGQDGSGDGVFGRLYDASGGPLGPEFRVNTTTAGSQVRPEAAFAANGDFVVVWDSPDGSDNGIFGQRFAASGAPQGLEFRVNTYTTNFQVAASVASAAAGDFVVVWRSYGQDGSGDGVFGQRYDESGTAQGSEFRVNTTTTNWQTYPAVSASADGAFVVVWDSDLGGAQAQDVYGQRYDAQGGALGAEFRINSYTTLSQAFARVAHGPDGGFVAVWHSPQDGGTIGIYGQRFDAAGGPVGPERLINAYTTGFQTVPFVAGDSNGGFVVVWTDGGRDGSGNGVFGRRLDAAGVPLGTDFRVNVLTALDQARPAVAATANGGFVVAWDSAAQDGSGAGVFASLDCARLFPLTPCRIVDTRSPGGAPLGANTTRSFPVSGLCGVPAEARAVAFNVTAVNPNEAGNLRIFPAGQAVPLASSLNFSPGRTRANNALVAVGAGGQVSVRCDMLPGSSGSTHLLLDVFGYFKR